MKIQLRTPGNPNFGMVVALAGAALLIFFVFAITVLHWDVRKLIPHGPKAEPNSTSLVLPASSVRV